MHCDQSTDVAYIACNQFISLILLESKFFVVVIVYKTSLMFFSFLQSNILNGSNVRGGKLNSGAKEHAHYLNQLAKTSLILN